MMKRYGFCLLVILLIGIAAVGCSAVEEEPEPTIPPVIPTTQILSPEPSPTETIVLPTPTNTPEPLPTATPAPMIPEDLELLSYRTLGQVVELTSLSESDIVDLDFSPNGRYLRMRVSVDEGTHREVFYDVEDGKEIFSLEGKHQIYFHPDNATLAALGGKVLRLIQLPSGEELGKFNSRNQTAAMSPDGRRLVEIEIHDDDPPGTTLRLIDLLTEEEVFWVYLNGILDVETLHFDQDGKYLAVTYFVPPGTYVSTVWDANTGRVLFTEYGYTEIVLHPFGSEIAVSSGRRSNISLFSTVTWDQKLYLGSAGEEPGYYDVAYASGGRLIYALSDRETTTVSFWYPPTGEKLDLELDLDLLAVTISPDRRLLATSDKSGSVIIWGVAK